MGVYLNPGQRLFKSSVHSEIYVDKSMLIAEINKLIDTEQKYVCISRPRRFGKSMAANMLAAYYCQNQQEEQLFANLKISQEPSFLEHKGKYHVIKINMQDFLSATQSMDKLLQELQRRLLQDLRNTYGDLVKEENLVWTLEDIYTSNNTPFIILIDEWDCIFREKHFDSQSQRQYLDFLRHWLKDKEYIALAYMTGILPIKKYGTHSALNMFTEYSMTNPGPFAAYFGFTEAEVQFLCDSYAMDFTELQSWYDGYSLLGLKERQLHSYSMYSPKSVVECLLRRKLDTYWNQTETYEALRAYILMDIDGLKQAIVEMLGGARIKLNIGTFVNDMTTFNNKDDVLTLLVHLGYLSYDEGRKMVSIPNKEVEQEYINAINTSKWHWNEHSCIIENC